MVEFQWLHPFAAWAEKVFLLYSLRKFRCIPTRMSLVTAPAPEGGVGPTAFAAIQGATLRGINGCVFRNVGGVGEGQRIVTIQQAIDDSGGLDAARDRVTDPDRRQRVEGTSGVAGGDPSRPDRLV